MNVPKHVTIQLVDARGNAVLSFGIAKPERMPSYVEVEGTIYVRRPDGKYRASDGLRLSRSHEQQPGGGLLVPIH